MTEEGRKEYKSTGTDRVSIKGIGQSSSMKSSKAIASTHTQWIRFKSILSKKKIDADCVGRRRFCNAMPVREE